MILPSSADAPTRRKFPLIRGINGIEFSMTTTVTGKNQVTIPVEIARKFNLHAGVQLEWKEGTDGKIIVKRKPTRGELARKIIGAGRKFLKPGDSPVRDLLRARKEDSALDQQDEKHP